MIKTHDFQDLMGVSIETEDKWLNKKLNSHICYGKGGGSSNQQQDVPPTLQPYITEILDRASDLYAPDKQYIPYEGERIVGFSPEELAAQEAVKGQVGQGILGDETLGAASTYYDPALGLLGTAGQLGQQAVSEITADEITGRMSPYQQAVTDIAKREAAREADIYDQRLKAQAAGTGGFGGSRQAILEAQAAADLGSRLSDIQTRGSQAAYQDAVRAAEAQRARQAAGAQAAGGLSQLYGGLGQQALGQAYREAGYLSGVGETQRGMQQQRADLAYQEFMRQQQYPTQQLQQFSSLVQGFPFSFGNYGQQVPSPFQQTVGTGLAAYGLGRNLGFFNQGGGISSVVNRQPGGSITPKQLQDRANQLGISVEELEKLLKETREDVVQKRPAQDFKETLLPYSKDDTPLSRAAKGAGRGTIELLGLPSSLIEMARSAGRATGEYLTTPYSQRKAPPISTTDFNVAEILEGKTQEGSIDLGTAQRAFKSLTPEEKEELLSTTSKDKADKSDKGAAKAETPSYLSAYNDSIKLLQERQKDIAGRREEGKAAIDEAFNLQLVSLGTLIATTPKDKLYEKLPKEITKFTKKKDLVELQDKYDKQELTNLLAQASIGESLAKIISEVGGSKLPTNISTEIIRQMNAFLPPGYQNTADGIQLYNKSLEALDKLSTREQQDSSIVARTISNVIAQGQKNIGRPKFDELEQARAMKQ
jgi:hypothetical protein